MLTKIIPFEPTHELDRFRTEISRLFNDSLGRLPAPESGTTGNLVPPVDIYTNNNELSVFVSLPGCSADDIDISATKDTLIIAGEMKSPNVPADTNAVRLERGYGTFKRVFRLPVAIDPDKVSATFKDGVLGIQLPLAEETKGRSIKVEVKTT